jgi:hypothetical protein
MTTKSHTAPDTLDVPAAATGGTIRVRLLRTTMGRPWAIELEYRYLEDDDDEPGDIVFLSLDALGKIGTFVKIRCAEWRREREHAGAP